MILGCPQISFVPKTKNWLTARRLCVFYINIWGSVGGLQLFLLLILSVYRPSIEQLIVQSIKCQKMLGTCPLQISRIKCNVSKLFCLTQKSKTPKYSNYSSIQQRKAANPQTSNVCQKWFDDCLLIHKSVIFSSGFLFYFFKKEIRVHLKYQISGVMFCKKEMLN